MYGARGLMFLLSITQTSIGVYLFYGLENQWEGSVVNGILSRKE